MTSQQSPYRCATCKNTACEYHKYRGQSQSTAKFPDEYMASPSVVTARVGCFSHSSNTDAREKVEKVIKELERERERAERDYRNAQDQNERQYKKAKNNTLVSAIALLKDGVVRK